MTNTQPASPATSSRTRLGWVLGLGLAECLCTGVGTSGYYVRTARSPSGKELAEFLAELPAPQ